MVTLAQNGWTAGSSTTIGGLDNSVVPGTAVRLTPGVRKGDVAVVAHYFASRFHREVEALVPGWCWGYAYRDVRYGSSLSNHAAGCAWDLNAPRHPLGVRGTFTGTERGNLRKILADCDGLVRWGGDYSGRADEMHFEIVGTPSQITALAKRLKAPTPPPVAPTPAPRPQEDDMPLTLITVEGKPAVVLLDGNRYHGMTDVTEWQALVKQGVPLVRVSQRVFDKMLSLRTRGA